MNYEGARFTAIKGQRRGKLQAFEMRGIKGRLPSKPSVSNIARIKEQVIGKQTNPWSRRVLMDTGHPWSFRCRCIQWHLVLTKIVKYRLQGDFILLQKYWLIHWVYEKRYAQIKSKQPKKRVCCPLLNSLYRFRYTYTIHASFTRCLIQINQTSTPQSMYALKY